MLKFLFRLGGLIALAGAFALTAVDGARWIAGGRVALTPLADLVAFVAPGRLEALDARLGAAAPAALSLTRAALALPASLVFALAAFVLLLIARPRTHEAARREPDAAPRR